MTLPFTPTLWLNRSPHLRYEGRWDRGKVVKGKYIFEDGLVYDERRWEYCPERDRRFYMGGDDEDMEEEEKQPTGGGGGEVNSQNQGEQKPIEIPPGCYDVGDGYYNPKEGKIYTYEGELIRQPGKDEVIAPLPEMPNHLNPVPAPT